MFNNNLDLPLHSGGGRVFNNRNDGIIRTIRTTIDIIFQQKDSRQIFYFLLLNIAYMFVQLAYGMWTNSLGLISDGNERLPCMMDITVINRFIVHTAIHMFFDCLALAVGLFATVMSQWPSNSEFTYGYSRIETVAAFFNGVFLIMISVSIVLEAVQRLIYPPQMNTHRLLFISFVGLLVNLVGIFAFNHGHVHHDHDHGGHSHSHSHSENMQGVFLHIMADTLGSVGVIVSTLLINWFEWTGFDPIASLFIATLIILSVIPLVKKSSAILMLELNDNSVSEIEGTLSLVKSVQGVYQISQSRFWPIESENIIGSVKIHVKNDQDLQEMKGIIEQMLRSNIHGLKEVCIQVEYQDAIKNNKKKGFFHTPTITYSPNLGVSSMNNTNINYRSSPLATNHTSPASTASSSPLISVLQKPTKKKE